MGRAEGNSVGWEGTLAEGDPKGWIGAEWKGKDSPDSNKPGFVVGPLAIPMEAVRILGFLDRLGGVELERVIISGKPVEFQRSSGADETYKMAMEVLGWHLDRADRIHVVVEASKDDGAEVSVSCEKGPGEDRGLALVDAEELHNNSRVQENDVSHGGNHFLLNSRHKVSGFVGVGDMTLRELGRESIRVGEDVWIEVNHGAEAGERVYAVGISGKISVLIL
jgi:hypothetical protein